VELEVLHRTEEYAGMLQVVREKLRLPMRLRLGLVKSGGPVARSGLPAPAWVESEGSMPMYGTQAFAEHQVVVYVRRTFLAEVPFETAVCTMAHELSHVVLDSIAHPLRMTEEAVDLTAMFLGFRGFYLKKTTHDRVTISRAWEIGTGGALQLVETTTTTTLWYGYLTQEEVRYAACLMQT
ncbi:hypothetical protein KGO04_04600, partial [Patescibacteria group bacterium]|nr:hypothetical protein [Patescibacteria group bacterium]